MVLLADKPTYEWWLFFTVMGMLGFGVGLMQVGKYMARDDVGWLSELFRSALAAEDAGTQATVSKRSVNPRN